MTPEEIQALQEENQRLKDQAAASADSVSKLEAKVEELLGESKAAKAARRQAEEREQQAEAERRRLAEETARNNGDVQTLENSWKEKLGKREAELLSSIDQLTAELNQQTVGRVAADIAAQLDFKGSGKLLMPQIAPRLRREIRDGKSVVVVLDVNGQPSASTVQDLIQEFRSNPELAPFVNGSKANGGGAAGQGSSAPVKTKLSDYSGLERAALLQENPALFHQLVAESKR